MPGLVSGDIWTYYNRFDIDKLIRNFMANGNGKYKVS